MVLADFSFWDFFWDLLLLMAWVIWFWLLITVFADLFSRHDTSGWAKVGWVVFVILLPYLGVLVYVLVELGGWAVLNQMAALAWQRLFDSYVLWAATDPAEQITKAKALLADGTITQAEFDQLKQKALS